MAKILITGATGNVGRSIIKNILQEQKQGLLIGSHNPDESLGEVFFDFTNLDKSEAAIAGTDILFLLRPPKLTDIQGIFAPLINMCMIMRVCTNPLKDWTKFNKQFRTVKLGNHETRTKIIQSGRSPGYHPGRAA